MLSITIDWLAMTFKEMTYNGKQFCALYTPDQESSPTAPTNGYRDAIRSSSGVVRMWHVDRPEMGVHVIFSGSALRYLWEHSGIHQKEILTSASYAGASFTRLDLATDAKDVDISLERVYGHIANGKTLGSARSYGKFESNNGGFTIYIGSRQSEKFVRIYDKAAESNLPDTDWKRYEIETKGMVARALAKVLVETTNWSGAFQHMAKGILDLPNSDDYAAFFSPDALPIGIPKLEKTSDREKWIRTQVLPAVARYFVENRSSTAVRQLIATLNYLADMKDD